jgi:hypothetical protein
LRVARYSMDSQEWVVRKTYTHMGYRLFLPTPGKMSAS